MDLQHAVASVWNKEEDRTVHFDMFVKHFPGVELRAPYSIKVLDSCHITAGWDMIQFMFNIQVSEFLKSIGNK